MAGINDEFSRGFKVGTGGIKSAFHFGGEAALDFDGAANLQSQRGLAHLARPQQCHDGRMGDVIGELSAEDSVNHPCSYGVSSHELQG